jgi:hypothetical protein
MPSTERCGKLWYMISINCSFLRPRSSGNTCIATHALSQGEVATMRASLRPLERALRTEDGALLALVRRPILDRRLANHIACNAFLAGIAVGDLLLAYDRVIEIIASFFHGLRFFWGLGVVLLVLLKV